MKRVRRAILTSLALLGLFGCANSPSTDFYLLASLENNQPNSLATPVRIGIEPLDLPDYLERPQIVTLDPPSGVSIDEFQRWAEPVEQGIFRVLAQNLQALDPAFKVYAFPSIHLRTTNTALNYRLQLRVVRFGGTPDGGALLDAAWELYDGGGKTRLREHSAQIREAGRGVGTANQVEAMSGTLETLSRAIADAIHAQSAQTGPLQDNSE